MSWMQWRAPNLREATIPGAHGAPGESYDFQGIPFIALTPVQPGLQTPSFTPSAHALRMGNPLGERARPGACAPRACPWTQPGGSFFGECQYLGEVEHELPGNLIIWQFLIICMHRQFQHQGIPGTAACGLSSRAGQRGDGDVRAGCAARIGWVAPGPPCCAVPGTPWTGIKNL